MTDERPGDEPTDPGPDLDPETEIEFLGWPPDGPSLRLDYRRFSYAGKFVMTNTGKAVVRTRAGTDVDDRTETAVDKSGTEHESEFDDDVLAAVAFNEDRTDGKTLWLRYVTVRQDLRGEGIGPQLLHTVRDRALERGYDRLKIAVNNPFAFEALARVGFGYTGETTGIAELVLEYPPSEPTDEADASTRYRQGLGEFRGRDLTDAEVRFLEEKLERGPPRLIDEEDGQPIGSTDGDDASAE